MALKALVVLWAGCVCSVGVLAQGMDVSQPNISGNMTASSSPFGQSFTPGSSFALSAIHVALVNVDAPSDLTLHLYVSDATGALIGSPLASVFLDSATVGSYRRENPTTPVWVPFELENPYAQTAGERLAFVLDPNPMSFYYGDGDSHLGGSMLGFPDRDLTFATIVVPEPSVFSIAFFTGAGLWLGRRRREMFRA